MNLNTFRLLEKFINDGKAFGHLVDLDILRISEISYIVANIEIKYRKQNIDDFKEFVNEYGGTIAFIEDYKDYKYIQIEFSGV
jgi:hypothetical protein